MKRSSSAALALALLLAACAPAPLRPPSLTRFDQAGNRYPDACMVDLTPLLATGSITVQRVPQAEVQSRGAVNNIFGRGMHGLAMLDTVTRADGAKHHFIYIAAELEPWQYEDSLRHELCHIVAGLHWHGVPN